MGEEVRIEYRQGGPFDGRPNRRQGVIFKPNGSPHARRSHAVLWPFRRTLGFHTGIAVGGMV